MATTIATTEATIIVVATTTATKGTTTTIDSHIRIGTTTQMKEELVSLMNRTTRYPMFPQEEITQKKTMDQ